MILFYTNITPERARIDTIHHQPQLLSPEQRARGIEIGALPEAPARLPGQVAMLYCNPQTGDVWFEVEGKATPRALNVRTLSSILGLIRAAEVLDALEAAASGVGLGPLSASAVKLILKMLNDLGSLTSGPGGIDLNDGQVAQLLPLLVATGILTQGEADAILAYGG